MKSKSLSLGALVLFSVGGFLLSGNSNDVNAESILDKPVNSVKPYIQIRPRYEYVDIEKTGRKNAQALTTRIKIGAKLNGLFKVDGLNAVIEGVDVEAIVDDYDKNLNHDPNDPTGKNNYETVLDPDNARLTQAYISYTINKTTLFFGRKYVAIDDHRFIGTVDWRQMPQSFGVVGIQDNTIKGLNILIAGIYERKGITDDEEDWANKKIFNADWKADKMPIIIDVSYKIVPAVRVKAFGYLITDIHNTYGVRADGKVNLGSIKLSYLGEYAIQRDPYENDNLNKKPDIDTNYYRLGGNLAFNTGSIGTFFGGVEYTHFGDHNNKSKGFSTPLATLHKFEGWSDVLLKGAANGYDFGMKELKVSFGYKHPVFGKFIVAYLDFQSDKNPSGTAGVNGDNIGSEWDFAYSKSFGKHLSLLLKGAVYNGKDGYVSGGSAYGKNDTTKYWVQLNFVY